LKDSQDILPSFQVIREHILGGNIEDVSMETLAVGNTCVHPSAGDRGGRGHVSTLSAVWTVTTVTVSKWLLCDPTLLT